MSCLDSSALNPRLLLARIQNFAYFQSHICICVIKAELFREYNSGEEQIRLVHNTLTLMSWFGLKNYAPFP